jgi:SAM-dependent methyltransferase
MQLVQATPSIQIVGLDTTPESVAQCREKNLEVYCETLESFQHSSSAKLFDHVVAFHCLEHVSDPKGLVRSMLKLVKPGGSVLISTPYSPMSFESDWFDVMNYPPHHMTRWNQNAYDALAEQLGCTATYAMPMAPPPMQRATNTFRLATFGRYRAASASKLKLLMTIALHPLRFAQVLWHQLTRSRFQNRPAADVILVSLTRHE